MTNFIVPKPDLSDKRGERLLILENPALIKLRKRSDKMAMIVLNFILQSEQVKLWIDQDR